MTLSVNLKARYFRFLDTKDWAGTEVFEPQFEHEMEMEQQRINGPREQFVEFVSQALEDVMTVHHGHNPEIELTSPTTARGDLAFRSTFLNVLPREPRQLCSVSGNFVQGLSRAAAPVKFRCSARS